MSVEPNKSIPNGNASTSEEQKKINEVKVSLGPLPEKLSVYCSDASIARNLRARNWNVKKATKMLKDTLKWRKDYKPDEIKWDEVASEAETGKIYRSNYTDKHGRPVLVMRPRCQNTKSTRSQIKYLVYCMENAIMNLPENQEQMVWLIDFDGYTMSSISIKSTRETAHVLQNYYPERLGIAILYNPPKFFEPFWTIAKPFLEPKTVNKVKFVYSSDPNTMNIMKDLFDMDQIESAFGGIDSTGFDITKYAERMRQDDQKMPSLGNQGSATPHISAITKSESASVSADQTSSPEGDEEKVHPDGTLQNKSTGKAIAV